MQDAGSSSSEVRIAAEWEPALGALIAWPLAVPEALVVEIASDDTLYLMVENEAASDQARESLPRAAPDDCYRFSVADDSGP